MRTKVSWVCAFLSLVLAFVALATIPFLLHAGNAEQSEIEITREALIRNLQTESVN